MWVLLLSGAVVSPHLLHLPDAIAVLCGLGWLLGLTLAIWRARLSKAATSTLVVAAVIALWFSIQRVADINFGFALLCVVVALKPLETDDQRARRSFVLLGYFCVLTFFFQDDRAAWLAYYGIILIALTGFLLQTEFPDLPIRQAVRDGLRLIVQAVPIAIVLFYAFPRLSEPLWHWTLSEQGAVTGVPKELELEGLGPLAESEEVAFKATFDAGKPDVAALYWRGPVFYFTDGRSWDSDYYTARPMAPERLAPAVLAAGDDTQSLRARADETIAYRVTQEAGSPHWLLSLDMPLAEPRDARLSEDYQLIPQARVGSRREYEMVSALNIETPRDPDRVYIKALQLPFKPRMARGARGLGENLRARFAGTAGADRSIIQQVLLNFAEQPFEYTLNAPPYLTNPIDEFLFAGRQGYCTHYAAAMTVILRAAAVPARMVLGYRSGDWDEQTDTLIVRQKHAHAWVEAWTEGHGWLRIDPTAVIPPDRIFTQNQGNADATIFNERQLARGDGIDEWRQFLSPGRQESRSVDRAEPPRSGSKLDPRYWTELASFLWNNWVQGFDSERQRALASASGGWLGAATLMTVLLAGPLLAYVGIVVLRARHASANRAGEVGALYRQLLKKLSARGLESRPEEPHQQLFERLRATGQFDPQLLESVFRLYGKLRYGQDEKSVDARDLKNLRRQVKLLLQAGTERQIAN